MKISDNEKKKFEQAKKRVEEIKGFYTHLIIYILVNIFLLLAAMGIFKGNFGLYMPDWAHFTTPFFWGIGVLFHGLYVFKFKSGLFKKWEERKIREFMERDKEELEKYKDEQ